MRLSLSVTNFSWRGDEGLATRLSEIAQIADQGGLDAVWVADHLLQADPYGARPGETEMLEAYTTLGYLAGRTERVHLGTMVTGVTFRPPALLVKAVTTLDVLSNGRALFGIGAGYEADEAARMGLFMPPIAERFDRLEETLQIALQMWAGDASPIKGKHYLLDEPVNSPTCISSPHPKILIGGTGERRTLPLVARYADACNVFDIPDGGATVRHKLGVLAVLCDQVGRSYDDIEKPSRRDSSLTSLQRRLSSGARGSSIWESITSALSPPGPGPMQALPPWPKPSRIWRRWAHEGSDVVTRYVIDAALSEKANGLVPMAPFGALAED